MSPRRHPPITTIQALVGTVLLVAAVAAVIGFSHVLLLPQLRTSPLPAPELAGGDDALPGEVVCPTRAELRERPDPTPVTSAELIECPALFDGRVVSYAGEAVGAVLLRSDHAWVHVNDDLYASELGPLSRHRTVSGGNSGMAVSVPRDLGALVTTGTNRVQGSSLEIVGEFWRNHPRDGGSPAIEALRADIVRGPQHFTDQVSTRRIVAASILAPVTIALGLVHMRRTRRR